MCGKIQTYATIVQIRSFPLPQSIYRIHTPVGLYREGEDGSKEEKLVMTWWRWRWSRYRGGGRENYVGREAEGEGDGKRGGEGEDDLLREVDGLNDREVLHQHISGGFRRQAAHTLAHAELDRRHQIGRGFLSNVKREQ